jgi:hypothetical protein
MHIDNGLRRRRPPFETSCQHEGEVLRERAVQHVDDRLRCLVEPVQVFEDDDRAGLDHRENQFGGGGDEPIGAEARVERLDLVGRRHLGADHVGDER